MYMLPPAGHLLLYLYSDLLLCYCSAVTCFVLRVSSLILSVWNSSLTLHMLLMMDGITVTVMVWRLTLLVLACSLVLADAVGLHGKHDPRTLTFSRSASVGQDGSVRIQRGTRSLKSSFVECTTPVTPREHAALESNTFEVREPYYTTYCTWPQSALIIISLMLNSNHFIC